MSTPRLANGRPLVHLGRGYVVLLGHGEAEVSTRAEGEIWIGVEYANAPFKMVLLPDHTESDGQIELRVESGVTATHLGVGHVDAGLFSKQAMFVPKGGVAHIEWQSALGVMA